MEIMCKARAGGEVNLEAKMIRPCHVKALFEAVNKYEIKVLSLVGNQLGDRDDSTTIAKRDAGAKVIARMLPTNRSLTKLDLRGNGLGYSNTGEPALREAIKGRKGLPPLKLILEGFRVQIVKVLHLCEV